MAQREWAKLEDIAEADLTPMLRQFVAAKGVAFCIYTTWWYNAFVAG